MAIKLGQRIKDTITGMAGVAVARAEYLHGTPTVGLQPIALKDGRSQPIVWLEESQVETAEGATAE